MIHTNSRLLLKPRLADLRVSVVHRIVVLLLLTHTCGGRSEVTGSSQTVVVMVGGEVTLPCDLEAAVSAAQLTVEWTRADLDPTFVHLFRGGADLLTDQHPSYQGRTSLSMSGLQRGDVSLRVSGVKVSDTGTYRCLVPDRYQSDIKLLVASVSSPAFTVSKSTGGPVLECSSSGWFPEPELLWLDAEGNLLSAGPTETVRGSDDLYTVSSRVTVEKRHSSRYTCRVQQRTSNQTRDAHIQVTDEFFMDPSSSSVRVTITLVVCFTCVLVVIVLVVWKSNKTKTDETEKTTFSNELELQLLMDEQRQETMTDSQRRKYLEATETKLDEQLEKNEAELTHVQEVMKALTEQKMDLKKQRDKLTSLQQEVKVKMEDNEKKLKDKPKLGKDKKMKKRKGTKTNLETTKKEHEDLIQTTEKLLEATEEMINRMNERKGKLEKEKEEINKQQKKMEKLKEELHKKKPEEAEESDSVTNDAV